MSGIGAGILLVPILTMGLGIEQHDAQTISLAILMPPVSLGAVVKYGFIESDSMWAPACTMLLANMITSGLGYKFSFRHSTLAARAILSALLMLAGVTSIIQSMGLF